MSGPGYYALGEAAGGRGVDSVFELMDFESPFEAYYVCAALKYGVRAGRKTEDPTEDLGKLRDCLTRAVVHATLRATVEDERRGDMAVRCVFTCDRCGRDFEPDEGMVLHGRWNKLPILRGCNSHLADNSAFHLCDDCGVAFEAFMDEGGTVRRDESR